MYAQFAKKAEEGFTKIAFLFKAVGEIEKEHEERYRTLIANLENKSIFEKDDKVEWKCLNCGFITTTNKAPGKCPVCDHPQSYFELRSKNYE